MGLALGQDRFRGFFSSFFALQENGVRLAVMISFSLELLFVWLNYHYILSITGWIHWRATATSEVERDECTDAEP